MKFEQFLYDESAQRIACNASVICLEAKEYPLLFCRSFISFFSKKWNISIVPMYMDHDNDGEMMSSLHMTFLGQTSWYWLHSDTLLTKKSYDMWHEFLHTYQGPHTLIFCTTKTVTKVPSSWYVVQLPDVIDRIVFKHIEYMLAVKSSPLSNHLFSVVRTISLDTAILLCHYAMLMKKNTATFFETWIPHLVIPTVSLFALSQALFERQSRQFFMQWQRVSLLYSPQFWISFWSEQFWRAYCYVQLQQQGQKEEAKKIGYRLPFSFLNNGWRTYGTTELQRAHALLYDIDYHIKQGGDEHSLELLYARFLNKTL